MQQEKINALIENNVNRDSKIMLNVNGQEVPGRFVLSASESLLIVVTEVTSKVCKISEFCLGLEVREIYVPAEFMNLSAFKAVK